MSKDRRKTSLAWEERFDDLYWDATLSEEERIKEIKNQVLEERRNTIRDILNRIMAIPFQGKLNKEQEEVKNYIQKWFNEDCLPHIMDDYKIKIEEE